MQPEGVSPGDLLLVRLTTGSEYQGWYQHTGYADEWPIFLVLQNLAKQTVLIRVVTIAAIHNRRHGRWLPMRGDFYQRARRHYQSLGRGT